MMVIHVHDLTKSEIQDGHYAYMWLKPFKRLLLQHRCTDLADILLEVYGAPTYIKQLNSFRSDHKSI